MKNVIKILVSLILIILLGGGVIFFFFPGVIIDFTNAQFASSAGLRKQKADVNGYEINYYISRENDKPETLILLHGLGDDKSTFLPAAGYLSAKYNLVLPDLAGHGENERRAEFDYSIYGQGEFLNAFLTQIGFKRFHLAGNSMGGHTVVSFAINYPEKVESIILINAAGLVIDGDIVYTGLEKIENKEDLIKLMEIMYYEVPDFPTPFIDYMIETLGERIEFVNSTLVPAIKSGKHFDLKNEVQAIKVPTLVIWGKHDGAIKFKVAEYYRDEIPNAKIHVLENAAHASHYERPEEVAKAIINFTEGN